MAVQTTDRPRKLAGYDFYHQILGSPKLIVAPMVDQSELAWRILSRRYGAQLCYTPMINAKMFSPPSAHAYRAQAFNTSCLEEGSNAHDRPLIVQFCANNPSQLLTSALAVQDHCDAVDINLGCPQDIAKKGHYGSFLMDEWDLIHDLINVLHENLSVPVTAKFRIFPSVEKTVAYAKMLESAGAQILTCHGRLRTQRGQNTGLADWAHIKAVKEAVRVPVFANGNILFHEDVEKCLEETGVDGVMSAEGQLYNPALFAPASPENPSSTLTGAHPPHADLALDAVKGHLFKIMHPALSRETDLRERLGRIRGSNVVEEYIEIAKEMKERMERDAAEVMKGGQTIDDLITIEPTTGLRVLPHWLSQPYFRPLKSPTEASKRASSPIPTAHEDVKRARLSGQSAVGDIDASL
ncbi:dihydrouridine synthase-domain-containing protein [Suillus subalutaceus]|uniref:dihydrouridine synthase-domain-containing protein n=1 Tax=Suillus subalutaceus TaxID=48586 RepID=UPI001B880038|nr:dihydrouridine synthase-domain-containing protein [Suillus subalutaceus]KAG1842232.1 dihydrouridine synthase-domain-containing protein [Suillus subalutaceus]